MATRSVLDHGVRHRAFTRVGPERTLALAGLGLTTAAFMTVLIGITLELGGTGRLLLHVSVAGGLAWLTAKYLTARAAAVAFGLLALVTYLWYFTIVVDDTGLLLEAPALVVAHTISDAIAVATGQSVLAIAATDVWAHSFAPAPIFLIWYFGIRRRYSTAATVAGATMLLFVLSGDLGTWATLFGTIGVVSTIGFGTIEQTGASRAYAEGLLVLIAAMAVAALLLPLVPSGGAVGPVSVIDVIESDDHRTLEDAVVGSGDDLEIIGEIELNPEVRYAITGDEHGYVRTGVYDYYTGSGWERTGETTAFDRDATELAERQPASSLVEQNVTVLTETDRMPSAGDVHNVRWISKFRLELSEHGTVSAPDGLEAGEWYVVSSVVPHRPADGAVTSVGDVDDRYLQLPEDVPDELHEVTNDLLEGIEGPHQKAERIVSFLRSEKGYSHNVGVPHGDLASGFLFDMNAGYCTYFATTAVVMLRSAGVPARLAVGYTSGQQLDANTSLIRGMNSHAWPEVYIDGYGWVPYEPTPGSEWSNLRSELLESVREEGMENVDIEASEGLPLGFDPTAGDDDDDEPVNETDPANGETTDQNESAQEGPITGPGLGEGMIAPVPGDSGDRDPAALQNFPDLTEYRQLPEEDQDDSAAVAFGLDWNQLAGLGLLGLGMVAGARRYRVTQRIRRPAARRWHLRRSSPAGDLARSADRLEWAMSQRFRPRHPGETLRTYHRRYLVVEDDPAVNALFDAVERARYGGEDDQGLADEAVARATEVVDDTVVFGGRLRPSRPAARGGIGDRIL